MSYLNDPELSADEILRRQESDRQSRKLGEKLLQGWCMLEETCPVGCLVPLMRSRQGRDFCVACNLFTDEIEEKQAQQAQAQAQAQTQAQTQTAQTQTKAKAQVQQAVDLEDACEPRCQIEHTLETADGTASAQTGATTTATTGSSPGPTLSSFPPPVHFPTPSASADTLLAPYAGLQPPQPHGAHHQLHADHHRGHVDATLATLYQKMEEARQRLAVTPVTQSAQLMSIITECARAIEALHALSTKY